MAAVERLAERLRELPGVEEAPSQFNRDLSAFWIDGREFVHFHGGEIEIRLTRRLISKLDDDRVYQRARNSEWVALSAREVDLALDLARRARDANRAA
jgi:luciferase-like monooxygenase